MPLTKSYGRKTHTVANAKGEKPLVQPQRKCYLGTATAVRSIFPLQVCGLELPPEAPKSFPQMILPLENKTYYLSSFHFQLALSTQNLMAHGSLHAVAWHDDLRRKPETSLNFAHGLCVP